MEFYSGVGSRETPDTIMKTMTVLAFELQELFTLRSGGAPGADSAFEAGVTNWNKEIYLPWKGFCDNNSDLYNVCEDAEKIAKQFHPGNWNTFKPAIRKLHSRNVYQVLGQDLNTPSKFLLCWTSDYCESHQTRTIRTGGTGTAISIADHYGVPIINMSRKNWQDKLKQILDDE